MYKVNVSDPNLKCKDMRKKLKILIVDDDENARESLKEMIVIRGHDVSMLDEGLKCVNRCSENEFDIIFMDYHINDMGGEVDGLEITNMIRDYLDINTIVYAYTGDNSTKAINDFKENDLKGVFIKPVDPKLMFEFLKIVEISEDVDDRIKLIRLAMKSKNFMYFDKKAKNKLRNIQNK